MAEEPCHRPGSTETSYAADFLRFYRATVTEKCRALPVSELRRPRLPSRWTPLELLSHLAHMEQRWFVWGFLGEQVEAPWGDNRNSEPDAAWSVPSDRTLSEVVEFLHAVAARTEEILAGHRPEEIASTGGRFDEDPPELRWICLHVLQEYARHAGHLDVVVELAGGPTGE